MAEQKQPLADYLHGSVDAVLKPILKELASMATRPQSEVAIRQFIIDRAATQQDERLMQMVQDTVAQMAASNAALGFEQKKVTLASGETVGYLEKPAKNAGGRTLVSLHGLSANADFQLFGCGHELKLPENVRCLVPELRGHGSRIAYAKENGSGWTVPEYAADVNEFLNAVEVPADERVDFIGYSLGGSVAMKFADMFGTERVNKVCLIAPGVAMACELCAEWRQGKILFAYSTPAETVETLQRFGCSQEASQNLGPFFCKVRSLSHGDEGTTTVKQYWTRMWSALCAEGGGWYIPRSPEDLDAIPQEHAALAGARALATAKVPTLLVQPDSDGVCHEKGARAVEHAFQGSNFKYVEVEAYGHYFHQVLAFGVEPEAVLLTAGYKAAAEFLGHV